MLGWYTGAGDHPRVQSVRSIDGGKSFQEAEPVSDKKVMGRVDATIHNGRAYLSFLEGSGDKAILKVTLVDQNSMQSITIDTLSKSRQTGFPQLEGIDDRLILAWTAISDSSTNIKTAQVNNSQFD